jgi:predicted nucleotidyltransferase
MIKFRPISHNMRELLPLLPNYLEKDKDSCLTYLFGSFASGKERKLSDVDIAVLLKEGIEPLEKQLNLLAEITFILKTDEVDLVILNRAPIALQYTIISGGKLLVNREDKLRRDYEEKVSQDYLDSEYLRTEHQKYLFQRLKGESGMTNKDVVARRLARLEKNIQKLRKLEVEKCQ